MTASHEDPQPVFPVRSIVPLSSSPILIGRQRESAMVMRHYEAVKEGHLHILFLTGEPGIGKTRLLQEIAVCLAQRGATVLRGGTSEAEGMPPYLPFLEALGHYVQEASLEQLSKQIDGNLSVLSGILPELVVRFGTPADPQSLPPEQARFRLYEGISSFLQSISLSHVLVLLFDDLHWADTASLDLICHLTRRQSHAQVLLVGAYRDCELDHNRALERTITELSRRRILTTMKLERLSVLEIEALAFHILGGPLDATVCSLLFAQSEGNPFFAEELLHGWIETGALILGHQQWAAAAPLEETLPPGIMGALRQRIDRLSTETINDLRVAAMIGRTFDPSLLAAIQQQEIEVIEDRLLKAVRVHLLQVSREGAFTFSHDKIRECLAAEVSNSRCRRLHGRIGHLLEERYRQDQKMKPVYWLTELAFHFARSDDQESAIVYLLQAARKAQQTFAIEEALSHYRMALALLNFDDQRRGNLLLCLGEVALMAGRDAEAEGAYEDASRWFAQENCWQTQAQAVHGQGLAQWRQDKRVEARLTFEYALALLAEHFCVEKVKLLAHLSVLLSVYMGEQTEGIAYAQQALAVASELRDRDLESQARLMVASNLAALQGSNLAPAVQFVEQMRIQSETSGNLAEATECSLHIVVASYWMAEIRRAHNASTHCLALVERCRQPFPLRTVYTLQVLLFASRGQWTEAEKIIALARSIVDTLSDPVPMAFLRQIRGFLAYQREDFQTAECELQDAQLDQSLQSGLGDLMFYLGLLGLVQATMGKEPEARTYMARVESHLALLSASILPRAPLLICLALTAITLGDCEYAKRFYPSLLVFQGQHFWFLVDRVLGLLALHSRQWEAAARHLSTAETTARREELRPELARILVGQAELEGVRGGQGSTTRARQLLQQALSLFEDLGMSDSVNHVHHRLRALAHQTRATLAPAFPANLTAREVVVLRLVVQGMSNSQIAQVLGLSEKTVTNHLTHIFNKTTCDNRAAATAFAIRHGLA